MQILIAEDDAVSRRMLEATLMKWGHEVVSTINGVEALQVLRTANVSIAILDWMMPRMDGVEVCRRVREESGKRPLYLILLTAKGRKEDIVDGLQAGADDYVTKPFNRQELHARLNVGIRIIELQTQLAARVKELEAGADPRGRVAGFVADLLLLQESAQRPELLGAGRDLHR